MPRIEFDLTLTGGAGVQRVDRIVGADPNVKYGEIRSVVIRYVSGDHTFTTATGNFCAALFPKALTATEAPDSAGRPTVAPNALTVPDERNFYRPAALTVGTASATTAYHNDQITPQARRMVEGPWSVSLQATVATGTTSTHRVSMEFGEP